ncbi:hypothetical protein [Nocardia pneumoniae]|nr:hypothetical protein [Nocardia pneumoniae]
MTRLFPIRHGAGRVLAVPVLVVAPGGDAAVERIDRGSSTCLTRAVIWS